MKVVLRHNFRNRPIASSTALLLHSSSAPSRLCRNRLAGNRTRSLRMKASDAGRYTTSRLTSTRAVRSRCAARDFACRSTRASANSSHRSQCGWRDSNPHGRCPRASEARSSARFRHNRDTIWTPDDKRWERGADSNREALRLGHVLSAGIRQATFLHTAHHLQGGF